MKKTNVVLFRSLCGLCVKPVVLMTRGANIRDIIATQVLEPHLKALAIYGAGHCNKMGTGFPGELGPRYGKERLWGISPFLRAAAVAKGRALFGLGNEPAYVLIAGSRWEDTAVDDMLTPGLSRFTFGSSTTRSCITAMRRTAS